MIKLAMHICPKFLYTHKLLENGGIDVQQMRSYDNLAYRFINIIIEKVKIQH